MAESAWHADDDPGSLSQRIERVLAIVSRHVVGAPCEHCGAPVCGHSVVFSIVSGHEDRPLCLECVALENEKSPRTLRDEMTLYIHSKPCLTQGWRLASLREGFVPDALPPCHWMPDESIEETDVEGSGEEAPLMDRPGEVEDWFDAGDQGCGELVLALRIRLRALEPGGILRLTASDPGAPEDIPSWCRLTGNRLIHAHHPDYFIERKKDT